jgi:hypothetical protein
VKQLEAWLPGKRFELLYRASRDGWASNCFHKRCDNRGPTLCVFKSTNNCMFGGYTDRPWTSMNCYQASAHAFLFSLRGIDRTDAVRLGVERNGGHAIYCGANQGPTFGGGYDLSVDTNTTSSNLGHTYHSPLGPQGGAFFTGSTQSTLQEMEVFQVLGEESRLTRL